MQASTNFDQSGPSKTSLITVGNYQVDLNNEIDNTLEGDKTSNHLRKFACLDREERSRVALCVNTSSIKPHYTKKKFKEWNRRVTKTVELMSQKTASGDQNVLPVIEVIRTKGSFWFILDRDPSVYISLKTLVDRAN